jgi:phospholipase C
MGTQMTRRQAIVAGAGAVTAIGGGTGISFAAKAVKHKKHHRRHARPLDKIEHIVFATQENRSFDNYFGTLAGVRGFEDKGSDVGPFIQPDFLSITGKLAPWRLNTHAFSPCTILVDNGWDAMHKAFDYGHMDKWVNATGPWTMSYASRDDAPWHMALADNFLVCDRYHCSVLGPTNPNRYYMWTGTIDPQGAAGGPAIDNDGDHYRWKTYPERLTKAGVSWRVYHEEDDFNDNVLKYFVQYQDAKPGDPLHDNAMVNLPRDQFRRDIESGNLPQVSWLIAATADSEHPGNSIGRGAQWCNEMLQALFDNPDVYRKTVFILTYDENGGYFDHVVPPTPPAGTPSEFVNGQPIGLGFRVPTVVVSPWTRGRLVNSDVFDHTSLLRLLEKRFGVREPNISAWRRKTCGDMLSLFDFKHPDTSIPKLPPTAGMAAEADRKCNSYPPAVPPVVTGSVPKQEPGTRIRRG